MSAKTALTLVETRQGCGMMETHPRYDVYLYGRKVGQLYFNMTGYVGTLPTPSGAMLHMPERGISTYKAEIRRLNAEFRTKGVARP